MMTTEQLKILVVDDHQIVREALRALLEGEPTFEVVGEAGDGLEAVRLARSLQPDAVLLDLMIPGLHGLEVIREIRKESPKSFVVVLSMYSNEAYVVEALRNGAGGYVLKDSSDSSDLVDALREVRAGRRYLSPPLTDRAIEAYLEKAEGAMLGPYDDLTPRERQVFQLVAEGHSNAEIARKLGISPRTVESHRATMMRKLDARTQADLVRLAIRLGLISLDD